MYKQLAVPALGLALALGLAVPRVSADQTFHTERLPLAPVGGAPLHQGFVVDVHANGPVIFAQERYVLVGAAPDATYQVELAAYPDALVPNTSPCAQPPILTIPETTLVTNVAGNGEAALTFSATTPPTQGTYNLQWHVLSGGTVVYETACTSVGVD